jgi:hypothetical protein
MLPVAFPMAKREPTDMLKDGNRTDMAARDASTHVNKTHFLTRYRGRA